MTGAPLQAFLTGVLSALGIGGAMRPWALEFMTEWARWENTEARNNPLATTRKIDRGETNFNSHGVKNYASIEDGQRGTVETIRLSHYTTVLASMVANRVVDRAQVVIELRTWGTTGFASLIANGWNPALQTTPPDREAVNMSAEIAALREELSRINTGIHRRFDWLAYGASQAEQPNLPPPAPTRVPWAD
jgi:hypothetical protein